MFLTNSEEYPGWTGPLRIETGQTKIEIRGGTTDLKMTFETHALIGGPVVEPGPLEVKGNVLKLGWLAGHNSRLIVEVPSSVELSAETKHAAITARGPLAPGIALLARVGGIDAEDVEDATLVAASGDVTVRKARRSLTAVSSGRISLGADGLTRATLFVGESREATISGDYVRERITVSGIAVYK